MSLSRDIEWWPREITPVDQAERNAPPVPDPPPPDDDGPGCEDEEGADDAQ